MRILLVRPRPDPETIGLQHVMLVEPMELEVLAATQGPDETVEVRDMVLERPRLEHFLARFSPDVLGVTGDSDLQDVAVELANDFGIELRRRLLPRNASSDHASFLNADIPAVFFMDNDFSRIHTPEDRLEFIRPELMGQSVVIGLALLDSLARP